MRCILIVVAAALTGTLVACTPAKPEYRRNPNPRERYEITMMIRDAPGPFTDIVGSMQYLVPDDSCVPEEPGSGIRKNPKEWIRYPVEQVAQNVYRAEVWTDGMIDQNYYWLGTCRWEMVQATVSLKGPAVHFMPSLSVQELKSQKTKTIYFSKRTYFSPGYVLDIPDSGEMDRSRFGVEVQDELFTITLTSRRIAP